MQLNRFDLNLLIALDAIGSAMVILGIVIFALSLLLCSVVALIFIFLCISASAQDRVVDMLKELSEAPGVPGYEEPVRKLMTERMRQFHFQGFLCGVATMLKGAQEDAARTAFIAARQARFAFAFCAKESCGKCTPCRIGSTRGVETVDKIIAGRDRQKNVQLLRDLCEVMTDGSLCALGGLAPMPVLSALNHFSEDFAKAPARVAAE